MRHIFHEILQRYLDSDQFAFDTTPRELWPSPPFAPRPANAGNGGGIAERGGRGRFRRELESQN